MAYGTQSYSQQPYGSRSFDQTAPSLVSILPAEGTRNVALDGTVTFAVTCPDGFDPYSLVVWVDSRQAIVGGAFLSGFSGEIVYTDTDCLVTISTHPDFTQGSTIGVQIDIVTLASIAGSSSFRAMGFLTNSAFARLGLPRNLLIAVNVR